MMTNAELMKMVDGFVEASARCDHILEHYAQTEFQIAQAKADLAKARATLEAVIVAVLPDNVEFTGCPQGSPSATAG